MTRSIFLLLALVSPALADPGQCPGGKFAAEEYLFRAERKGHPYITICMDGTVWCKHGCQRSMQKLSKQVRMMYRGHTTDGWDVRQYVALNFAPTLVDLRRAKAE